jgi:curved DNA-binding protein
MIDVQAAGAAPTAIHPARRSAYLSADGPAMTQRDLYEILGVQRSASEKEIRKAYRDLARRYHPDRNPGNKQAEERFKEASYASDVLLNKEKRALYDEFGENGLKEGFNADAYRQYQRYAEARGAGGGSGFAGFGGLEDLLNQAARKGGGASWGSNFQDLFGGAEVNDIFGGRGRSRRRDTVSDVTIEFMEAVRGSERELSIQSPGSAPRTVKVRIPAGVTDDGKIRLRGQGQGGGDLVLRVHVQAHPYFERDGKDLLLSLPVTVGEAHHGAKVSVPTPDGPVTLRIPPGSQSGRKLRLRGKGVRRQDQVGDLIVELQIVLPEGVAASEHVDKLEALYRDGVRKHLE